VVIVPLELRLTRVAEGSVKGSVLAIFVRCAAYGRVFCCRGVGIMVNALLVARFGE